MMTVLDLFSGIGGFTLGLQMAGDFRTVAFCERDQYCQGVLAKHWPDTPIHPDIRELDPHAIGPVDLICGGYPCQPFSAAGERSGKADDRYLWPEMRRIVAALRPAWVLGENVAGHVSMGLDDVLSDLEGEGYAARPFIVPACAVDAFHRRDRVFVVAHTNGDGEPQSSGVHKKSGGRSLNGSQTLSTPDTSRAGLPLPKQASILGEEWRQEGRAAPQRHRWSPEPSVGRVAHGVPHRVHRIKGLGNAVVPQLVAVFGRAILNAEEREQCQS